jgi:quercetin dioxygenase-like cupin family protein
MSSLAPVVLPDVTQAAVATGPVTSVMLFVGESFIGVLVCVLPGQSVPLHRHEHKDESFDVIEGNGVILVGDKQVQARPGALVFVPAGTLHGLRNDTAQRWLLRETVHERVYARTALRLVALAILKRIPYVGKRWR